MHAATASGRLAMFMAKSAIPIKIAVLGFDGCSSGVAAGMLEFFAAANVAARTLPGVSMREPRFECRLLAATRSAQVRASHGVLIDPARPFRRCDAILVPPVWAESVEEIARARCNLGATLDLLRRAARSSDVVASACSGAVLLAEAGLLAERRATTCWWLADWFREAYPDTEVSPESLVEIDGRVWTAAAGTAYLHLCLDLVSRFAGAEIAMRTSRLLLVEPRRGSQSPFLGFEGIATDLPDPLVERARLYMEEHLSENLTMALISSVLGVSQRTLHRHLRRSQGMSPQRFLQLLRIARAKALLQVGSDPVAQVAECCGYRDPASFRKLFARQVGLTPGEYRARFSRH